MTRWPDQRKILPGLGLAVRDVYCIGRNYLEHARELSNPVPQEPVVFLKPASSVVFGADELLIPLEVGRVDHEVELVLVIGETGRDIAGVGVGIDVTARDIQDAAKKKGLPWARAKGMQGFAPVSSFRPLVSPEEWRELGVRLFVDGKVRQEGWASEMIFDIPFLITYLSQWFSLGCGDLIFTGTPQGVGPILSGSLLRAELLTKTNNSSVALESFQLHAVSAIHLPT